MDNFYHLTISSNGRAEDLPEIIKTYKPLFIPHKAEGTASLTFQTSDNLTEQYLEQILGPLLGPKKTVADKKPVYSTG